MSRQVTDCRVAAAAPSCFTECLYRLQSDFSTSAVQTELVEVFVRPNLGKAALPVRMRRRAPSVQAGVMAKHSIGREAQNFVAVCWQFQQRLERQFQQWQRQQQQPQQQQLCSPSALVVVSPCPSVESPL